MQVYSNLTSVLEDLQKRGFVYDFSVHGDCIACDEAFAILAPGEYEVAEVYRFEISENPTEVASIYAISSTKGLNGIVVNPCSSLPSPVVNETATVEELCVA